ncbi:MAG: hypothetical protein CfP315_0646 [Candidatus Improbicoccus pseudotrichonymphae]|uniref:Uncharacterized protein n=1 Tax=Candidatus Improbicoccus pseudotrichonymphae TaxID=3033792 RepID=A0AA48KX63_9FIRM|nr:MAG: hypothetical protein CfP315_0646 [Candidatus Improbicoccus pseudotrichonymphae]
MKKESNGIGENKNSKKISKNNKIISSILAIIMCCQSFVGANPNSDNREFVSDKGIDNNPAADGSEKEEEEEEGGEEVKDIKSKENNSSGLIGISLDIILFLAAAVNWWFYVTKNKDLKSKNKEIERLNEKLKRIEELEKDNEENKRLKKELEEKNKELEEIYKPITESDARVEKKKYLGTECITFNVGERVKIHGRTFFRNLTDVTSTMGIHFTDNENNKQLAYYDLVFISMKRNPSKLDYDRDNDYKQLSDYSKCVLSIFEERLGCLLSKSREFGEKGITRASQLKKYSEELLVSDQKVGPNFRFTNIVIFLLDKEDEEKGSLFLFVSQELLDKGFLVRGNLKENR